MTKIIFILSLIALVAILPSKAQTSGSNSPYSRYGWGNLSEEAQGFNKGMAGTGLGARGRSILNYQNPASYSAIDSITFLFDAGISLQRGHWSENGTAIFGVIFSVSKKITEADDRILIKKDIKDREIAMYRA